MFKRLITILATLVVGYVGLCGLAWMTQRRSVYYPQFTRVEPDAADFEFENNGVTLRGWAVHRDRTDALLYFGGNAERIELMREPFARWLPRHTVYLAPYRGYGPNGGTPTEKNLFADAGAWYDTVQALHPQGTVSVMGRSLGSGVASYLASVRPVEKLILVTPFDSLAEVGQAHYRWLPVRWLARDRYESAQHLRDYDGSVLIIRAGRDQVIPRKNTDRLIAILPRSTEVLELPDAGHNTLEPIAYGRALTGFLR